MGKGCARYKPSRGLCERRQGQMLQGFAGHGEGVRFSCKAALLCASALSQAAGNSAPGRPPPRLQAGWCLPWACRWGRWVLPLCGHRLPASLPSPGPQIREKAPVGEGGAQPQGRPAIARYWGARAGTALCTAMRFRPGEAGAGA